MAKKILTNIDLFTLNQTILLVEGDKVVDSFNAPLADIPQIITYTLSKNQDIEEVELQGN